MGNSPSDGLGSTEDIWLLEQLLAVQDDSVAAHPELDAWLSAVRRPASVAELTSLPRFLQVFEASHGWPAPGRPPDTRPRHSAVSSQRSRRRHRPTKVVVLAASALVALGGTAAAAYIGVLPAPLQSLASHLPGVQPPVEHPGSVPSAQRRASPGAPASPSAGVTAIPGQTTAPLPAVVSACSTYLAHTLSTGSVEYQALVAAAGKASRVSGYCTSQLHAAAQRGGHGQPSTHPSGQPTTNPGNKPSTHPSGKPASKPTTHGGGKPSTAPTHSPHA